MDHFTGFAQAYATKSKSAVVTAKHLYNDFVLRFGIPTRYLHDQGGEFENRLFAELEKFSGVIKSRTTPYHPQTNGIVERMNSTLLKMLRALPETLKKKWHEALNKQIFAYNATKNDRTGHTPYFLMFGREPLLAIDVILGIQHGNKYSHTDFATNWKKQMQETYQIVQEKVAAKRKVAEEYWKKNHVIATKLLVGDKVLIRNTARVEGPRKLQNYWENDIYVIKSVGGSGDVVYKVCKEGEEKKTRTVH